MPNSPLANRSETKRILDSFGLDTKYSLGQNFLVDDNIIGNILRCAELDEFDPDRSVLEIGPGIGTLTVALLDYAPVVSVEQDKDLVPVLAETTALNSDRFNLIQGDVLKVTREQIERAYTEINAPLPKMLVANLPYAVAATVILDWFQRLDFLETMVVMVQSEVADRIGAEKGVKDYGAYSIKLRMYARTTDRFQVSPACFYPPPRVESAVIRLERQSLCDDPGLMKIACELADAAFAQRRKNIRNSMRSRYDVALVDELLACMGIDPKLRGETLDVEDYLKMARTYRELVG